MALAGFKPTLWSRRYIVNTDKALVFKNVVDTSWEGELRYGETLKVNQIAGVTVSDYTTSGVTWQNVDDAGLTININQRKSFSFVIEDIDASQMNVSVMDGAMRLAAHGVADAVDQFIAGFYTEAGITNATNLGSSSTGLNFYANDMPDLLTYMMRYLKEANAPGPYWCVAPPWMMQLIRHAQITNGTNTFDSPNAPGLTSDGVYGMGFTFYESNNVSNDGTDYRIMFGSRDAIALASQLSKIKATEREDHFDAGVKGLYVYGGKVVRPDHLGCVYGEFTGLTS